MKTMCEKKNQNKLKQIMIQIVKIQVCAFHNQYEIREGKINLSNFE